MLNVMELMELSEMMVKIRKSKEKFEVARLGVFDPFVEEPRRKILLRKVKGPPKGGGFHHTHKGVKLREMKGSMVSCVLYGDLMTRTCWWVRHESPF